MFQLVSSFSPWAYVHISSTCKEIQRNLAFLWTQNGNPKQLYNLDICLFRLQLSYLGFSLNKTRNHSHPQEGINSVILMLVLRTTEGSIGNLLNRNRWNTIQSCTAKLLKLIIQQTSSVFCTEQSKQHTEKRA